MKSYLSAIELAGLPGMPTTVRGVNWRAKEEKWAFRPRKGRGGGREYSISSLPEATRDHLMQQELNSLPVQAAPVKSLVVHDPEPLQPLEDMKQWQREIFDARCIIYREFEKLKKAYGTTKGIAKLLAMVETETLPEHLLEAVNKANARSGKAATLSRSLILRWQKQVKESSINALAPLPVKKSDEIPAWVPYFIKAYNVPQKPTIPDAMHILGNILPDHIEMPTYDQVKRYNSNRSALDRERGRSTGSELSKFKGYIERTTEGMEPGEVFMCDGHSFKSKVAHFTHNGPFHPEVCAVIDVLTRVVFGWSAGVAESGQTVADALRHAITVNEQKRFGCVPAIFYTDGGSGNISKMNSHRITGFYARLGITHKTGIPGNAQGRGLVERLNQSLWIRAARKLPTFTGRGMDEATKRKVYLLLNKSARKGEQCELLPNWSEFIRCCEAEVQIYNRTPHTALPKWNDPETGKRRHMAPLEYLAVLIHEGWRPTTLPEELVNDMFYPQVFRTVTRGAVKLFGNRYSNRNVLEHYNGQVIVEYDIHDAESVRVRDLEQRLLCVAKFRSSKQRFFPKEVSQIAMEKRADQRIKLLEGHIDTAKAELGTTIETRLSPLPLTDEENRLAQQLLEDHSRPEIVEEFDESLLDDPTSFDLDEEFDESLLECTEDTEDYEEMEEPSNVIDARDDFRSSGKNETEAADTWEDLDGWERWEELQRRSHLTETQEAWCNYYKTTKEYLALQEMYKYIDYKK